MGCVNLQGTISSTITVESDNTNSVILINALLIT